MDEQDEDTQAYVLEVQRQQITDLHTQNVALEEYVKRLEVLVGTAAGLLEEQRDRYAVAQWFEQYQDIVG